MAFVDFIPEDRFVAFRLSIMEMSVFETDRRENTERQDNGTNLSSHCKDYLWKLDSCNVKLLILVLRQNTIQN